MEDELRLFLLLGGSVFIIGVLAHGIWKIRNNSKPEEKQRLEPRQLDENDDDEYTESRDDSGFDELGIGSVRVVGGSSNSEPASDSEQNKASTDFSNEENRQSLSSDYLASDYLANNGSADSSEKEDSADIDAADDEKSRTVIATPAEENSDSKEQRSTLYGSVITNPKPHIKSSSRQAAEPATLRNDNIADFPEPPDFLLRDSETSEDTESSLQAETPAQADSSLPVSSRSEKSASTQESSHDATTPSNTDANSTTAPTKSVPRSEVPKATSTLYVDATRDEAENAGARVEPIFSDPLNNESYDEKQQGRQRLSKTRRSKSPARKREEPNFGDDQMRIDFDDTESQASSAPKEESPSSNSSEPPAQEVLILNVRAPNDAPISGAALLPMLLTLGFKFGDQDIFHRHVNSNGKGPVLFSLANMFKPGVFDIDNLENFDTQGVSLFMILPIEGDPHQVFNMMHNAARKLADEFNAQVLDGRRSVLTKQGLQQYVEKIREFERKRMISRS